jgi:GT2 family glycosyltransferase
MTTLRVTAVVVAYESGPELLDCVRALLESRYRSLDVLVVDNGSRDPEPARSCAASSKRVELIRSDRNLGFAGAVNLAMKCSLLRARISPIHALVNPDCSPAREWLGPLVAALAARDGVAIVGCRLYEADGRTLQHAGATIANNGLTEHLGRGCIDDRAHRERRDVDYVTGALCAFRTDTWSRIGPLHEGYFPAYFEEVEFCVRARERGLRVVYVPESEAVHTECSTLGRGSARQLEIYHRNRLRFLLRNVGSPRRRLQALRDEIVWFAHLPGGEQAGAALRAYRGAARDFLGSRRAAS